MSANQMELARALSPILEQKFIDDSVTFKKVPVVKANVSAIDLRRHRSVA